MVEAGRGSKGARSNMWKPRQEGSAVPDQRAVPPWAEPDAQPPPPPSTYGYGTLSPPPQRRSMKPVTPFSSAKEPEAPAPTHFNKPVPGASPVMARRSLFRNNATPRAKSVDSVSHAPSWAEHRLKPTPRTDSPSRVTTKTDEPSWKVARTEAPPQQEVPKTSNLPTQATPGTQAAAGPSTVPQAPTATPQVGPSAVPQGQPSVGMSRMAPAGTQAYSKMESSSQSSVVSSSFTREVEVSERRVQMLSSRQQHSSTSTPALYHTLESSATQVPSGDPPWRRGPSTQAPSTVMVGQSASVGHSQSQAQGQVTHQRPPGPSEVSQQPTKTMVSVSKATESQAAPGNLPQEQSSPTPWRKNASSRAAGAKAAAPTPQQQQPPPTVSPASVVSVSEAPSVAAAPTAAARDTQAPQQGPQQQAPWRKPVAAAAPVEQDTRVPPAAPAAAVPQAVPGTHKTGVTPGGQEKSKGKTDTKAASISSSSTQAAEARPNWRKQQQKNKAAAPRPAAAAATTVSTSEPPATSTAPQPPTATQPPAAVVPQQASIHVPASVPAVKSPAPVTSKSPVPPVNKPASPAPPGDKSASPVLFRKDKTASPLPATDRSAAVPSPTHKTLSPVPPASKSVSPVPSSISKSVSPVPAASVSSVSVSGKSVSVVAASAKTSVSQTSASTSSTAALSAAQSVTRSATTTTEAAGVTVHAASVVTKAQTLPGGKPAVVSSGSQPPTTTSPALVSPVTTSAPTSTIHSPTPPLPPRQTAAEIVSAPAVPEAPKPVPADAQPAPVTTHAEPALSTVSTAVSSPPPAVLPPSTTGAAVPEGPPRDTMPIPTPPPAPDPKAVKSGGVTSTAPSSDTDSADKTEQIRKELSPTTTKVSQEVKPPPQPEFPPPPPLEQAEMPPPGYSEDYTGLPPPPAVVQEVRPSEQLAFITELCGEEDPSSPGYVRESVTKRIKAFEKQASKEEDAPPAERFVPTPRPVAPWVKKTSMGPVSQENYWDMTSPEEPEALPTWPSPPPPQPPQKETSAERTMSPSRVPPTAVRESPKASPVPVAPTPPTRVTSGSKVTSGQPGAKVTAATRPRAPITRQRSASTGEYHAHYVTPDVPRDRMPAEGNTDGVSPDAGVTPSVGKDDALFDAWCDPKNPRVISFQDVSAAAFKIKSGIMNTPCTRSHMSNITDMEIYFKKEFNQYTGSFKERGARYTLLMLTQEQQKKGVIAASAGNHALALSYHGQDLGIPVTVVMPLVAPIMKVQACRQYGANIIVKGNDIGECREHALKMAHEQGLLYINGYDHPHILAGQGTMGLEIVEQVPNIDAVVIPVGGGGLIAGVALAVKALYPQVQVIGVESEKCPSFSAAMKAGRPVYTKAESTLADGLAVPLVGVNAFATASKLVDKVVTVKEEWIAISILRLVETEKAVVEGAGATALAAILAGELPELKGKRVVIPLCGGNIDTTVLGRCLERGLAADGRLVKFTVTVSDRPGGIAELTRLLANLGVSIKDMVHERAWIRSDIFSVEVKVMAETRDYDHWMELKAALLNRYDKVRFAMPNQIHEDSSL